MEFKEFVQMKNEFLRKVDTLLYYGSNNDIKYLSVKIADVNIQFTLKESVLTCKIYCIRCDNNVTLSCELPSDQFFEAEIIKCVLSEAIHNNDDIDFSLKPNSNRVCRINTRNNYLIVLFQELDFYERKLRIELFGNLIILQSGQETYKGYNMDQIAGEYLFKEFV